MSKRLRPPKEMFGADAGDDEYLTSRSDLKKLRVKEEERLATLALQLIEFTDKQRAPIPLDDDLLRAVQAGRATRSHVARGRQLRFIRKLLRPMDIEPLEAAVEKVQHPEPKFDAELRAIESWLMRLLSDDPHAMTEFIHITGCEDIQRLRQARRAVTPNKPKSRRDFRKLIAQHLRTIPQPGTDAGDTDASDTDASVRAD